MMGNKMKDYINNCKLTTDDNEDVIISVINSYKKYKNNLPNNKRDITKLSYLEIKNIVTYKEIKKLERKSFKKYMEDNKGADKIGVKLALRKFYDLYPILPNDKRDVNKMSYLELTDFLQNEFVSLLTKPAYMRFVCDESLTVTVEQIIHYIGEYFEKYDRLPSNIPPLFFMSFDELENVLDGIGDLIMGIDDNEDDYTDIETIYDNDNLLIFKPNGKEQCIRLSNGRSWCISKPGGGNMYYHYRLNSNLTIYYVVDKDKPFSDVNYAVVILVDPYGNKRIADGKNMSGGYSGHNNEVWSTIVGKVSKLKNIEHLFVANPLSVEEQTQMNKYKNTDIYKDPIDELGSEQAVEMWIEIASPDLTYRRNGNDIYKNFTENLKNKYLSLGMDLTSDMIINSEPNVLKYYAARKMQDLMRKSLNELSDSDITFLNSSVMKENKEKLKEKFSDQLSDVSNNGFVSLEYPKDVNSKYVVLFGFEEFFKRIPLDTTMIQIENTSKVQISLDIPESIGNLTELKTLVIDNMVRSLPESIGKCGKLKFINLPNNSQLEGIPEAFSELYDLKFLSTENSNPNMKIPNKIQDYMLEDDGFWSINFPDELISLHDFVN
jgi:hypothetical protein